MAWPHGALALLGAIAMPLAAGALEQFGLAAACAAEPCIEPPEANVIALIQMLPSVLYLQREQPQRHLRGTPCAQQLRKRGTAE